MDVVKRLTTMRRNIRQYPSTDKICWSSEMDNTPEIRLNVCKSWSCPNLGIPDAPDYSYPVYRLGYAALECNKCGSLPPLFNEDEFNYWFSLLTKNKPVSDELKCPHCCATAVIRYGRTSAGNSRFQCRVCRGVFTPRKTKVCDERAIEEFLSRLHQGEYVAETSQYRLLEKAARVCEQRLYHSVSEVKQVATVFLVLPFQGQNAEQHLYIVISADARSGRVLQITTNYSDEVVGDSLCYKYVVAPALTRFPVCSEEHIRQQELQFMQRSQFDEIQYGRAQLKRNDRGCILRPVMAIHGHFQRLKQYYPAITDHYLAHECVLRGAAITAWSEEVRHGVTHLWFVVEDGNLQPDTGSVYRQTGTWNVGWWKNVWQRWSAEKGEKVICSLTGQPQSGNIEAVSLSACEVFIRWLQAHPWSSRHSGCGPKVISHHLVCLAHLYNEHRRY